MRSHFWLYHRFSSRRWRREKTRRFNAIGFSAFDDRLYAAYLAFPANGGAFSGDFQRFHRLFRRYSGIEDPPTSQRRRAIEPVEKGAVLLLCDAAVGKIGAVFQEETPHGRMHGRDWRNGKGVVTVDSILTRSPCLFFASFSYQRECYKKKK